MKVIQLLVLVSFIVLLAACGDAVIDASSSDTMSGSYKKIYNSLTDENEKKQFQHAYHSILYSYRMHVAFRNKGDSQDIIEKRVEHALNGKNVEQILLEYKNVRKIRALWEIERLQLEEKKTTDDETQIRRVSIADHDFYRAKEGFLDRMFLDVIILNGSRYKLSSATFSIKVGSLSSDAQWPQKKRIFVEFPDDLEPGAEILRKIDLGRPTFGTNLPKDPILSDYSTSRISGQDVDILSNHSPTSAQLKESIILKKNEYKEEFAND